MEEATLVSILHPLLWAVTLLHDHFQHRTLQYAMRLCITEQDRTGGEGGKGRRGGNEVTLRGTNMLTLPHRSSDVLKSVDVSAYRHVVGFVWLHNIQAMTVPTVYVQHGR